MRLVSRLLTLALALLSISISYSQKPNLHFRHISSVDGLSYTNVQTILQDHIGYMWFGTGDGLNKYDGYQITVYKHHPKDTTTLSSNDIIVLFEDSQNNLWIGSRHGLNRYQRDLDHFIRHDEIEQGTIMNIIEDSSQTIWVTMGPHIFMKTAASDKFVQCEYTWLGEVIDVFYQDSRDTVWASMPSSVFIYSMKEQAYTPRIWDETNQVIRPQPFARIRGVRDILEDENEDLWLAAIGSGLIKIDGDSKKQTVYAHDPEIANSLASDLTMSLAQDSLDRLWIGLQNEGLNIFDKDTETFYHYKSDIGDPHALSHNTVQVIYEDRQKNMWIGTFRGGVNLVERKKFTHIYPNPRDMNSLGHHNITSFCEINDTLVWVGTDGDGVNRYDLKNQSFSRITQDPRGNKLPSDVVTYMLKDHTGRVWLGHWEDGLSSYDPKKKTLTNTRVDEGGTGAPGSNSVMYLYEDKRQNLWVATFHGLKLFNRETGELESVNLGQGLENYVIYMLEDRDNNLLIGTWEGLKILDRESGAIEHFTYNANDPRSLNNNKIYVIHEDKKGRIWIGTAGGLNLFNKQDRSFDNFLKKENQAVTVYGILEDDKGNLWLSAGDGLIRFNPEEETFRNYTVHDGLQSREFKHHAFRKLRDGRMLFGGINGFNIFHPDQIDENDLAPPVVITGFNIFNQPVKPGEKDSLLQKHISQTDTLTLSYEHSVISFEFAALNYIATENNEYAYKLEGFDKVWNYSGTNRTATYTNLNPGEYTFRVKASNNDGVWNKEGASLLLIIKPPFYRTWWFALLSVMLLIGISVTIYWNRIRSEVRRRIKLEKEVKRRTSELAIQAAQLQAANEEIVSQGLKLENLYNEMKDSIRAAKTIQQTILTPKLKLDDHFPSHFIFNKPKDVVGGDFHWFESIHKYLALAAVDCTGHGVSGAFMSIIGHQLLNESVASLDDTTASGILYNLHRNLMDRMDQDTRAIGASDGMDLALCVFDIDNNQLQFAGAKSPLYIVRGQKLVEVKGNNYSIGMSITKSAPTFANHEVDLKQGDTLYMFSDGFADQFGGSTGQEKLMYPRFRKMLLEISKLEIHQQKEALARKLEEWQNGAPQLDDILVIGIRIE